MRLYPLSRLSLTALMAAVALGGCATTEQQPAKNMSAADGVLSHQVALMPYETQGITVAGTTNWYDGQTEGLHAYATHGGIVYIDRSPASAGSSTALERGSLAEPPPRQGASVAATPDAACLPDGISPTSKLLGRYSFHFASADELYADSASELAHLLAGAPPKGPLHVVGYTDDRGNDDINLPLSAARAESVAKHIEAAWPENTVTTEGRGSCPRLASNADADGRARNRRVEIYLLEAR